MALGKGLASLIPKKKTDAHTPHVAPHAATSFPPTPPTPPIHKVEPAHHPNEPLRTQRANPLDHISANVPLQAHVPPHPPKPPHEHPRQQYPFPVYHAKPITFHREPPTYEVPNVPTEPVLPLSRGDEHIPPPISSHHIPPAIPARRGASVTTESAIFQLEASKIKPNPYQPRREFNTEELNDLAQSIREFGILQPLVVSRVYHETPMGTDVEYQLIAGERRLRAAQLVGLERVPAIVRNIDLERVKLELAVIENVQRSNLTPIEAARAYARLQEEFGLTQREVAQRVGKSREAIANVLRLLNLPLHIQTALKEGKIGESQARMLLSITNHAEQERVFNDLITKRTTVREMQEKITTATPSAPSREERYWETQLEEKVGAPVRVVRQGSKGKVVITFHSDEEWQGLMDRLLGGERDVV